MGRRVLYVAPNRQEALRHFEDMLLTNAPAQFCRRKLCMAVGEDFFHVVVVANMHDFEQVRGVVYSELRYVGGYRPSEEMQSWLRTRIRPMA